MADSERDLQFRSTPMKTSKTRKYDILRVPGGGAGGIILLGETFLWHTLHYWRRRSTPCFGDPCEACDHNCPIRERGYIAVTPRNKVDVMVLEVTDQCEEAITAAAERLQSLRGQVVGLGRLDKASNGKLRIEFGGQSIDSSLLPESPDVAEIMRRIWGMGKRKSMQVEQCVVMDMQKLRCQVIMPATNGKVKA